MWERFGYYLMLGIFPLYLHGRLETGGMGRWTGRRATSTAPILGLVYLTPFIGGLLADRILGFRKSIFIGGVVDGGGYLTLAVTT